MESKKIAACGSNGTGHLVKCFMWDTGNTTGDMAGHTKTVSSLAYKPSRPFRIMTGSEDSKTCFYGGPPFKLDHSNESHTNFVNSVRYSADGNAIISVSTDKKIQKYDGKTGLPLGEVVNAHEGGVYSVAFSPDGSQFATASADKTIKLWSTESMELIQTFKSAADAQVGDMQVAVFWSKVSGLMSLSLKGSINLIDSASTDGSIRFIDYHQTPITAMTLDPASRALLTGSSDGVIISTSIDSLNDSKRLRGTDKRNISGAVHGSKVTGISVLGGRVTSVGWDDKIRFGSLETSSFAQEESLEGQPCALAAHSSSDLVLVVTTKELALFRGDSKVASYDMSRMSWSPLCGALLKEEEAVVGGSDNKTHVFSLAGIAFTEIKTIDSRSAITAVAYSPLGDLLAIGDAGRQVEVYERKDWSALIKGKWVEHTSRITALAWSPSGGYLASGSLDESIYVWNYSEPSKKLHFPLAHVGGVSQIVWGLEENEFFSGGNDAVVVKWTLPPTI